MEKIRVNMTPIEEVKTIHASQNDNATRKWAFDLYDENGKIDSSSIKEQMIFDSRVGGTEQILPVNGSDPTTSPIIADIQYPDSLRSEQTFLYRESPTTVNGQSKITRIKGNTVVFNQLVQNGNFADTSAWSKTSTTTLTVSGNVATVAYNGGTTGGRITQGLARKAGHKYLISCELKLSSLSDSIEPIIVNNGSELIRPGFADSTSWKAYTLIFDQLADDDGSTANNFRICSIAAGTATSAEVRNVNMHDLTQMGLDYITSVDQFTSLYPLSYYAYTQGKLLPFMGESLKIVGKNLVGYGLGSQNNSSSQPTTISQVDNRTTITVTAYGDGIYIDKQLTQGKSYRLQGTIVSGATVNIRLYSTKEGAGNYQAIANSSTTDVNNTFVCDRNGYLRIWVNLGTIVLDNLLLEESSSPVDYEPPYKVLTLPTLTYFPTGIKRAGNVFDELTENNTYTRIGSIDLTSIQTWNKGGEPNTDFWGTDVINNLKSGTLNIVASKYSVNGNVAIGSPITFIISGTSKIRVYNTGASTMDEVKSYVSGVMLYYELATPTEESITTASLVTEKGETPLYYDDELIADCNETISSESGIFDAKIKLMTDETIYSQKIQLHVERKPQ